MKDKKDKGYVLLLAVLISSIILAMSLGIFSISLKEVMLATFARDSVRAFAASSRGLECAMFMDRINQHTAYSYGINYDYYDSRGPSPVFTPFARGLATEFSVPPGTARIPDIGESWSSTVPAGFVCSGIAPTGYSSVGTDAKKGTSSFSLDFGDSCATVVVEKDSIVTRFTSNGYSDKCASTNPRRTQRTIEVSVNL